MSGKIRTREKCPRCGGAFKIVEEVDIFCPECGTKPESFFIRLYWQGKENRISQDRDGHKLDSFKRAHRFVERIRSEIDARTFSIADYQPKEIEQFRAHSLLPKWYASKISLNRAPTHLREVKRLVEKLFIPFFKNLDCRDIRTFHIEDFFNTLSGSDKTKKNYMIMLKNFCHWLNDRDILLRLPKFPDISPAQPVITWTTKEVQHQVVAAVPEKDRPIFQFAIYHPIRPGELRALRVKDFLVDQGMVQISRAFSLTEERSRKNKKPYYLPLSATFDRSVLKAKLPEAFVFLNAIGRPYTASGLRKIWHRACKNAKVPYINFYSATRHSTASQALNAGVSLDRISAALGHSNLEITRRYASLNVQNLLDVVDGLGQDSDKQKIREINPRIVNRKMVGDAGFEPATPAV
jgi:integrase